VEIMQHTDLIGEVAHCEHGSLRDSLHNPISQRRRRCHTRNTFPKYSSAYALEDQIMITSASDRFWLRAVRSRVRDYKEEGAARCTGIEGD
ncbi:hypothetical protein Moror_5869, partial [Moniliophthora roreri MCA 2997]